MTPCVIKYARTRAACRWQNPTLNERRYLVRDIHQGPNPIVHLARLPHPEGRVPECLFLHIWSKIVILDRLVVSINTFLISMVPFKDSWASDLDAQIWTNLAHWSRTCLSLIELSPVNEVNDSKCWTKSVMSGREDNNIVKLKQGERWHHVFLYVTERKCLTILIQLVVIYISKIVVWLRIRETRNLCTHGRGRPTLTRWLFDGNIWS